MDGQGDRDGKIQLREWLTALRMMDTQVRLWNHNHLIMNHAFVITALRMMDTQMTDINININIKFLCYHPRAELTAALASLQMTDEQFEAWVLGIITHIKSCLGLEARPY